MPLAASAAVPASVVAVLDTILPPRQFRDEAGVAWTQVVSKWAANRLQVDPGPVPSFSCRMAPLLQGCEPEEGAGR